MKEPDVEGVATHDVPESCGGAREGAVEALTEARAGRVSSRVIMHLPGADAVTEAEGHTSEHAPTTRGARRSGAVQDPMHVRNLPAREPGDPLVADGDGAGGRVGKA